MSVSSKVAADVVHKPLSQTVSFWLALATPIVLGLGLGVVIGMNSSLGGVCLSTICINYFIEVYKVPITISGLSLPLVAMVAAIQRSKEAFVQIRNGQKQYSEAVSNNRFGNFLKHREGFYKLVENFREIESNNRDSSEVLVDVGYLYIRLFPKNSFRSLEFEQELTGSWLTLSQRFQRMEENIKGAMSYAGAFEMADFLEDLQVVLNVLTIRLAPSVYCEYERDEEVFRSIIRGADENIDNVIETATLALRLYLAVSSYAGFDTTLSRHNILYSLKVFEMLEFAKVNVKFDLVR